MLEPQEYAPGRRVKFQGQELDVKDTLALPTGNIYLIVNPPDSHAGLLVSASAVQEEGEAVDPEEVQRQREAQAAAVTDAPDVTVPQGPSPEHTQGPPPPAFGTVGHTQTPDEGE